MKKRVLVVENNADILELISLVLGDAGYEVEPFINERNIFDHISTFQPDAILLDIIKPTMEGTELCRQIKQAKGTTHIPVIVLSTHPQIHKVKNVCADEVIMKPFDIDGLVRMINSQLKTA